jgi:hypothetical protein
MSFTFSEPQRKSILKAVHDGRRPNSAPMTNVGAFFMDLEMSANGYLNDLPYHKPPSKQVNIWASFES